MKTYTPHYVLKNVQHLEHKIIEMFFGAGITHLDAMLEYNNAQEQSDRHQHWKILQKNLQMQRTQLEVLKNTASVTRDSSSNTLTLTFNIPNADVFDSRAFREAQTSIQDGRNMAVRSFLDMITQDCMLGMVEIKHTGPWTIATKEEYAELEQTFSNALQNTFKLKSSTFWIDGEQP